MMKALSPDHRATIILIIMYIYHALINALSAHMIHINLNIILYTHVEHSPTKTIYIKYYIYIYKKIKHTTNTHTHTHTHTDCSRNWVLILVRMEILWEEEGFHFGFKRRQGWAVSKTLWEWIPNGGSKAREGAKARSLAFVSLDCQKTYCMYVVIRLFWHVWWRYWLSGVVYGERVGGWGQHLHFQ